VSLVAGFLASNADWKTLNSFAEINLIDPVQQSLSEQGYETPTPIQAQTIPPALAGEDVLGCAQTGTGKTAAFALPILDALGQDTPPALPNRPLALVLAPTRELAIQIADSFSTYGRYLKIRQTLLFGGVNQFRQVRSLDRGTHLVVATPGRLLDLMNQGHIQLNHLQTFVLDEADRMLDMGFLPDLKKIIAELPDDRQSLFFSATLPPKIVELSEELLDNPVSINVTPETRSVDLIEQQLYFVDRKEKRDRLHDLLSQPEVKRAVVFARTKRGADQLCKRLVFEGINASAIHGDKTQGARQRALNAFRRNQVHVLVATDVAARGIDVDGITHVVNYDLPDEPEAYVHRIGRTGRAGESGVAISYCCGDERAKLRAIEKLIGQRVPVIGEDPRGDKPKRSSKGKPQGKGAANRSGSAKPSRRRATTQNKDQRRSNDGRGTNERGGPQGGPQSESKKQAKRSARRPGKKARLRKQRDAAAQS